MADLNSLRGFLQDVVIEAQNLLGIAPPGASEETSIYLDDKVFACAVIAYSQCENYTKRKILKSNHRERYDEITEEVYLKNTPVASVGSVQFRYPGTTPPVYYTLVLNEDYYVDRGIIYLNYSTMMVNISSTDTDFIWFRSLPVSLEVSYLGGYARVSEDSGLYTGLLAQTVANFHRKETLGLATVRDSGGGSVQQIASSDSVVTSARDSWNGLVYYGSGESV